MKKFLHTLILTPLVCSAVSIQQAHAQTGDRSVSALYDDLRIAVCLNDWDDAMSVLNPMIESAEITESYRTELIQFRQRVENWQSTDAQFSNQPGCGSVLADSEVTAQQPRQIDVVQSAEVTQRVPLTTGSDTRTDTRVDIAQCLELANVMNWAGNQSETLLSQSNFSDLDALVQVLSGLATVSEQAADDLQTLQLSNRRLQSFQRGFISIYERFDQVTNAFVNSVHSEELGAMEQQNAQLQNLAEQEFSLINQVNAYCGRDVIAIR